MNRTQNKEIWVFADGRNERHFTGSLKVLSLARRLAAELNANTVAVLEDSSKSNEIFHDTRRKGTIALTAAADRLCAHGADYVYLFDHDVEMRFRTETLTPLLAKAVRSKSPLLFLFPLSDFGRELAARAARLCNAGLIADCIDIAYRENRFVASCPSWGGEILAEITYADGFHTTAFATVQAGDRKVSEVKGTPGTIIPMNFGTPDPSKKIKFISRTTETESQENLEEAEIVVVGGAGAGSADGFALIRELAASLGGEAGATRPPVLLHWTNEDRLIGQTGKKIRPRLLISAGTSGAVQYTAGITESEIIVAINRDLMAPIFQIADIGIVADLKTLLPLLTSKIKSTFMRGLADSLQERDEKSPHLKTFGTKLRKIRTAHGFTFESLAEATGQTPEAIEQFEKNEISPSVAFLLRLSQTLKIDPGTFLSSQEKKTIEDRRSRQFVTRTQNYSYQTLTPDGKNEHLRAFMVTIEARQAHKPVAYKHEGEEFIYVMDGKLELTLGGKIHRLNSCESIHFNSEIPHKLKSISDTATRCLVVLYTP